MTHGVTSSTSKLEYQNQSGALNEAMSDIFGEAVEARTRGASDWLHGADLGTANRSLKDPHSLSNGCSPTNKPYPAKMSEFLSATSTDLSRCVSSDYGGVHINSSIINHAFYQLTAGLPGAIGMRDAERIFYRALTLHLAPKSQFVDARLAAVTSADELFGKNSTQSQKVAQAFDYVEIVDTTATAPPAVIPAIAGVDSTMFLFKDAKGWQLGRRETALGDANGGNYVVASPVSYEKIAVDGGGNFAIFITADNDFCVVQTNGSKVSCAGLPHSYNSAALSPSGRTVALVLLDNAGDPKNQIVMVDVSTGASTSIVLRAAATDGASLNVLYADAMVFDFKKSRLFYDAVTELPGVDGAAKSYVWAIYALDIASSVTVSVIPPIAGLNVANPTLGHVRNDLLAFDALDPKSGDSAVYIYNLTTGKLQKIGNTVLGYGFPTFTGDDKSLVYSHRDSAQPSGRTLLRQALGTDFMTPAGAVATWLTDGDVATVYRRGTFASGTTVVEYYHSGLDNYFITADPIEQSFVDSGGAGAWKRTNLNFKAGGTRPVCRFYGNRFGPNSHFYTADEDECASLISNYSPAAKSWGLESYDFATTPSVNGTCSAGLVPVYRAYNNGFARGVDSNHRITSNVAAYQQTIASGWKGEGVTMCAPQ